MKIKNILIGLIILLCSCMICTNVFAEEDSPLKWATQQTGNNTFRFTLSAENIDLNYVSGVIQLTNGRITNIQTIGDWINRTGNEKEFYFYRNGISRGTYQIAYIDVEIYGDSSFEVDAYTSRANTCAKDPYGLYFGPEGTIITEEAYRQQCFNGDATLRFLYTSSGTLSPEFNSDILKYTITVPWNIDTMTFDPIVNVSSSKVITDKTCKLNGPGSATTCEIIVEAENGTRRIYQIIVNREKEPEPVKSNDTSISDLVVGNGTLTEEFRKEITEYTIYVKKGTEYVSFEYTLDSDGSKHLVNYKIETLPSVYELVVTAEDGKTTKIYRFNILELPEEEPGNKDDNKPEVPSDDNNKSDNNVNYDKGEVENPETGDVLKPTLLIGSLILLIVGYMIAKKKNIFHKI